MGLRLQELVVDDSDSQRRSWTVRSTVLSKCLLGALGVGAVAFGAIYGVAGLAIGAVVLVLAAMTAVSVNSVIADVGGGRLLVRSSFGPFGRARAIPFESIKLVTVGDGGAGVHMGGRDLAGSPTPAKPVYSLGVEIVGKKHVQSLITGVSTEELVREANNLANLCGKNVFISSALK